jgi:GT2 family glycosyltransferase
MDLSVIIVNYNVRHFLEQCLNSVRKASENIDCEIFVVDNNSADGSCSMVARLFPQVKLIRNSCNAGFSAANNQAIKMSAGKFILLLNPDTLVEEDTFRKCLAFMKNKPDAGALGVKMINGSGKLLPESKRSLPTPETAFYKMSGLSVLFPRSPLFNRYYLGNIDNSNSCEVDIISGAFMFIRREALEKTGLLDEAFFMYGEDIDLSYRILKSGYKNWYFPEVQIIHYKGESTRKGEVDYIVHFYKAMIIFVNKHFIEKRNRSLIFIIQSAVYFWGFIALLKNLFRKTFLPLSDGILLSGLLLLIIPLWENYRFNGGYSYPPVFSGILVPSFTLLTLLSISLTGGYKIPSKMAATIKGILLSSAAALAIYSLLPLNMRFSRAVVLLCGLSTLSVIIVYRLILSVTGTGLAENILAVKKRVLFVGNEEGFGNIRNLLEGAGSNSIIAGRVSVSPDDTGQDVLGFLDQIREVIRINRISEVIFSTSELTASKLINSMQIVSECNISIRIAPHGEKLLIGSKSVDLAKKVLASTDKVILNSESGKHLP